MNEKLKNVFIGLMIVFGLALGVCTNGFAAEARKCSVDWAYNGAVVPESFTLYNGEDKVFTASTADRVWEGTITLHGGSNVFTLAAVGANSTELARSAPYTFEYIEGSGGGSTIQMRMTWEVTIP